MAQNTVNPDWILVVGGSAGSLEPLMRMVGQLPAQGCYAVVAVIHRKAAPGSVLADLLAARTKLEVKEVEDKEPLHAGILYLAPPDYHLLFEGRSMLVLDASEKVHYSRPSIDVSFESAATAFKANVIAVLLSGANADGAEGMRRIKAAGGVTIVQEPATAEVYFMPQQAIRLGAAIHVVPAADLPLFVAAMVSQKLASPGI